MKEKLDMGIYIYRDNRTIPAVEIFRCEAENILEADHQYKENTGQDPVKQPYVGCEAIRKA